MKRLGIGLFALAAISFGVVGGYSLSDAGKTTYVRVQSSAKPSKSAPPAKNKLGVVVKSAPKPSAPIARIENITGQPKSVAPALDTVAASTSPSAQPEVVAAPVTTRKTVTIIFLHGGCWLAGSEKDIQATANAYKKFGYNAIPLKYRDGNDNILHQIENVRTEALKYKASGPVFLYGISAGGTLAAALAAEGVVDGAVIIGSPTNLTSSEPSINPLVQTCLDRIGMSPQDRQAASPLFRFKSDVKPSPQYLQYAVIDELVAPQQGQSYSQAIQRNGGEATYVPMKIIGHKNIASSLEYALLAFKWIAQRTISLTSPN